MISKPRLTLKTRLARVELFLCDVDGILTDATVSMNHEGEYKRFCVKDGLGIKLLRQEGIRVGWISGRSSPATEQRAKELKVDFLYQSGGSKVQAAEEILRQTGLNWNQVCFMGDDLLDLGLLRRVGLAVAVPEALREVKEMAHYVTRTSGGYGAVREVIDMILKSQKKWNALVQRYSE